MRVRSLAADVRIGQADRMDSADRIDAAELHRQYLRDIFQYVSRRVPRQEAEDITMQVFAAALQALPRFRGDCPPRLWLLGIAHRKVVDALRRRAARPETLASEMIHPDASVDPLAEAMASALEGPAAAFERAEAQRMVRRLVEQLNPTQREALLLQYVEELPIAEIAVVMGRSPAAVNSLLQRARATMFRLGRTYFLDDDEGDSHD